MRKIYSLVLLAVGLLVGTSAWADNVAKIGTQEYATLKDAVDAVQTGETIVLIGNLEASTSTSATAITIDKEGVAFTLDLNGQHIMGGKNTTSYGTMRIENGDITIMDSQTGGYIGKSGTDKVPVYINGGSVTLNSGIINGYQYGVYNNAGMFTMNGGSINVSYTSTMYGIYSKGHTIVNGGTIVVQGAYTAYGVSAQDGVVDIYGGFISATNTKTGATQTAYAANAYSSSATACLNIYGGKFYSQAQQATNDISYAAFVGGGKFARGCDCSDGYQINTINEKIDNITYTKEVVPVTPSTMVAEVGSTQYGSLAEAFINAPDNSTIKLIGPITSTTYVRYPKKTLTLDLNNQEVTFDNCTTASSQYYGRIHALGQLTITDNSTQKGGVIKVVNTMASEYCIAVPSGSVLVLENGTIHGKATTGTVYGVYSTGTVNMMGGIFKCETTTGSITAINNYGSVATITGGKIHIKADEGASPTTYRFAGSDIPITGGVFTREGATSKGNDVLFGSKSLITSGQFNFDPSAYLPVGDKMVTSTGTETITPFEDEQTLTYAVVTNPNPTMRVENINSGVKYASPLDAIDAANEGEELRMLVDINVGELSLNISKGIIFDLNGKTLEGSANVIEIQGGTETYPIIIVDKAATKGKIVGKGGIINTALSSNAIIRDVEIEAMTFCFKDDKGYSNTLLERVKGTIQDAGTTPAQYYIIEARPKTSFTLKDCEFLLDYPNAASKSNTYSIVFINNTTSTIVIDGGTYQVNINKGKANILEYMANGFPATVLGGYFKVNASDPDANTKLAFYSDGRTDKKLSIQGGYFNTNTNPTQWVASTHGVVASDNPDYQYKVIEQAAASVAGVTYGSVQEAIDAVTANPSLGAITLLRNVTISNTLELPASATFAATDYTITLNGSPAIILQSGATLPTCLSAPMQVSAQKSGKTYYYTTFSKGLYENNTIKLETDVTCNDIVYVNQGSKTIDLNGHTLSGNQSYSLIEVGYWYGAAVLNIINTAQEEGVVENLNADDNAHVIDINERSSGIIYDGSYAKVTIGENVKIKGENGVYIWKEGSSLDVYGSIESEGFAIVGNGSPQNWGTTIHIYEGANIKSTGAPAIYHPQDGTLTIDGGTIEGYFSGIEIRAGELNINGGSLTSTYDGFDCNPNGSGTTTVGAALAIAQHTTKQPITVNISGGHFRGNYAVSQCNPQQNPDEYLNLLNIEVTGGYFWSSNGANIISVTENRRLFLKGGVYNLDPNAFTVNGYFSKDNNPELYEGSYAQGYVYKVAQQEIKETETKGTETTDWAQTTTWNTDLVPDYATNVTIGKNIVVTTSAEANKVTIADGKTLTIKDGGTLIIGNGGIIGATAQTFKVEAGGQVLIAPNAENATLRGSVDLLADRAGLKPSVASYTGQGSDMYWQHIAIPTDGAPESITPSVTGKTFLNTWNIVNGWQNVGTTALSESFKGYNLGNFHPYSADGSQSITYTFVGKLVGNQPDYMVFAREGHSFFGNSYLAPLDVATMLSTLYQSDLEYTINVYDSQNEIYAPVNEATALILGIDEIKPLQGFFIYAANATQAQLDYNSAVYTAYLNKHAVGGQTAAPVRRVAKANTYDKMAQITVAATSGEKDVIYLFEDAQFSDAEDNGFDARNLEHSGLDMSIVGSYADLSVLATDNLEGAVLNINTNNAVEYTMTFSHVQGDMTLTDNVTGAVITMQEGATYTFVAQSNAQLSGRFAINAPRRTPTNNENISINPAAKGIYTMMGQYVGDTSKWETLPAGVYVVDGVRVSK